MKKSKDKKKDLKPVSAYEHREREPDLAQFKINPEEVQREYSRVPSEIAYANQQCADALYAKLKAKAKKERVYAALYEELSQPGDGEKRLSETAIKQKILDHKLYQAATDELIDAEYAKAQADGVAEALRAKRDMVQGLGAHVRAELGGNGGTQDQEEEEDLDDEEDEDDED